MDLDQLFADRPSVERAYFLIETDDLNGKSDAVLRRMVEDRSLVYVEPPSRQDCIRMLQDFRQEASDELTYLQTLNNAQLRIESRLPPRTHTRTHLIRILKMSFGLYLVTDLDLRRLREVCREISGDDSSTSTRQTCVAYFQERFENLRTAAHLRNMCRALDIFSLRERAQCETCKTALRRRFELLDSFVQELQDDPDPQVPEVADNEEPDPLEQAQQAAIDDIIALQGDRAGIEQIIQRFQAIVLQTADQ